ncbi:DUF2299 domain-containing protein [bacterium]|nr:MAG: DUF2299 domain-containing protein [bacterium]
MEITTVEQAKEQIKKWLVENHHQVNEIKDDGSSFHFEVDYPVGSPKRQRVLQPKEYPGLIVVLNGVSIANEHAEKIKTLTDEDKEKFYGAIRKDLLFLKNSYDINLDDENIAKTVQFSFEFYIDSLTKTSLFEGLLLNHRTLIYIVTKFNDKFGIPVMPNMTKGETVGNA